MRIDNSLVGLFAAVLAFSSPTSAADSANKTPAVAVSPQYDTTHVYVAPEDFDRFTDSLVATFGGTKSKQGVFQVTPTPSQTISQLVLTPAGSFSVFGFKTPVPYPFGEERTGYLVTDMDQAVTSAKAHGADVIVAPFPDPIGRDVVIVWPGGVHMQLYWHTTAPNYPALQTVPENRVYISPERADAFIRNFVAFSHGKVVSDNRNAPGIEIGRPGDIYRRVRIDCGFGKLTVLVTDGHLPWPYGHEMTGYEVADINATLAKAKTADVKVLVEPFTSDQRTSTLVQFPGGYIAEIHAALRRAAAIETPAVPASMPQSDKAIDHTDIQRWETAWNSHDIDAVLGLMAPNVVINQPSNPKPLDLADARAFFGMIFKAYPDFHVQVTDAVIQGPKAVSIERVTGTWSGPFIDPATKITTPGNGRKFDHPGAMVISYQPDHSISNVDIYWDRLVVNQQLGITP